MRKVSCSKSGCSISKINMNSSRVFPIVDSSSTELKKTVEQSKHKKSQSVKKSKFKGAKIKKKVKKPADMGKRSNKSISKRK